MSANLPTFRFNESKGVPSYLAAPSCIDLLIGWIPRAVGKGSAEVQRPGLRVCGRQLLTLSTRPKFHRI